MAGFEPASSCYKHHCSFDYPTAILFLNKSLNVLSYYTIPVVLHVAEMFVIDHKEKSSCLITNNFGIN